VRYAGDSIDGMRDIIEIAQVNAVARGAGEALIEPEDVSEDCGFQHIEASPEKAIERINGLIGQTDAKKAIIQIGCDLKLQRLRQSEGLCAQQKCMHMLFTGNPGTGKTTFARLISEYFRELGLLSRGKFMEVSRANLNGMYSGWTIKNTKECFNDADGGVLFVDEAPTLISSESDGYGREALNQICYEMENRRRDMIVIFAGYQEQMDKLLAENPGLRDRFAYRIHFKDYAQTELEAIMQLQLRQSGMELDSGAWELAARYIADMLRAKSSEFGNGRSVRRLVERMGMHQAERIVLRQEKDYRRITAEDVAEALGDPDMRIVQKPKSRTIGFGGTA
jgi:SpoVK/Ycf46/Vps4 family AAA+-type ATPase